MKKLLFLLVAFFALTARAFCTDIDIGASNIVGLNTSNAGVDTPLSGVTVTLGSAAVTCSNCLPTGAVGISGLKVSLGTPAVTYDIASVASRSVFTLTSNYLATSGTVTGTLYKFVHLRIYVTSPFVPAGSTTVIQSGSPGTTAWYRRYGVSVINDGAQNVAYIPQIDNLPATTDSSNPLATYVAGLYTQAGGFMQSYPGCVDEFKLNHLTTPTSWAQICSFNSTPPTPPSPPANFYTAAQIDARFPSCTINQLIYYASTGNVQTCLTINPSQFTISAGQLSVNNVLNRIQEEGSNLPQQPTLNFIGSGLTAADDPGNSRTNVTVDSDLNALASNSTNGFWARTGAGTGAARLFQAPAAGFTITNNDGVSGNPTFVLANDLAAVEGLSTSGIATRTATDTWTTRTITGTANRIGVTNGDGVAGNPTLDIGSDVVTLAGTQTLANKTLTSPRIGTSILDVNGNTFVTLSPAGSAVNGFTLSNSATGASPSFSPTGSDSNLDFTITPKGTGKLGVGTPGGSPVAGIIGGPDASGTNTAGVALDLHGGRGTGNAEQGQLAARYPLQTGSGTTVQSLSTSRFPVSTSVYSNVTAGNAVANTTTETSILTGATGSTGSTLTLQGGVTMAGTVYRIRLFGTFTTTGTPTIQFRIYFGATLIANGTAVTSPNNSNGLFAIQADIYAAAVGAGGSVRVYMRGELTAGTGTITPTNFLASGASVVVDFTANQVIDITAQWGTANAANTLQFLRGYIERIR
jgi:hypothetical protein